VADCLFCKIASKEVDSDSVYESDDVFAFRDINPGAPTHVLVIPKKHIESACDLQRSDADVLAEMFEVMRLIGEREGLDGGLRIVTNVGPDAGQSVPHLHFHVLGGRQMAWPPG
jgi:histidine triad (HIT) family protein